MKPIRKSRNKSRDDNRRIPSLTPSPGTLGEGGGEGLRLSPLLAFAAHPDDIEFACGGIITLESRAGRAVHFAICSQGESASHGTPAVRRREATSAAKILGATAEFVKLDGDAHLELRTTHAIALARIIRRIKPAIVLAPTTVQNQHPDHWRLGTLVRDAARLARYGGVPELKSLPSHSISQLLFYASTCEAEPKDATPLLVDVSDPTIMDIWKRCMEVHKTQTSARKYVDLQFARARARGLGAGVEYAIALFSTDPLLFNDLSAISRGARGF